VLLVGGFVFLCFFGFCKTADILLLCTLFIFLNGNGPDNISSDSNLVVKLVASTLGFFFCCGLLENFSLAGSI
jgi:hypothetical protein